MSRAGTRCPAPRTSPRHGPNHERRRTRILILGANFAGLTTARYVALRVGDRSEITVIDRKPYLTFIPNIPLEVWNDNNPEVSLHLPTTRFFEKDGSDFVQGEVRGIDVESRTVHARQR